MFEPHIQASLLWVIPKLGTNDMTDGRVANLTTKQPNDLPQAIHEPREVFGERVPSNQPLWSPAPSKSRRHKHDQPRFGKSEAPGYPHTLGRTSPQKKTGVSGRKSECSQISTQLIMLIDWCHNSMQSQSWFPITSPSHLQWQDHQLWILEVSSHQQRYPRSHQTKSLLGPAQKQRHSRHWRQSWSSKYPELNIYLTRAWLFWQEATGGYRRLPSLLCLWSKDEAQEKKTPTTLDSYYLSVFGHTKSECQPAIIDIMIC